MKLELYILILLLSFTSCKWENSENTHNDELLKDSPAVTLTGKDIFVIYSHGGSPAQVSNARFEIANPLQKEVSIEIERASFIEGNRDTLGNLTIREDKKLTLIKCLLPQDTTNVIHETILLKPQKEKEIQIIFDPISVEISYRDNYRAIQLELKIDGELVKVNSKLLVEREDDLDKY